MLRNVFSYIAMILNVGIICCAQAFILMYTFNFFMDIFNINLSVNMVQTLVCSLIINLITILCNKYEEKK